MISRLICRKCLKIKDLKTLIADKCIKCLTQRSKVPPFLYQCMEESETKQELLPDVLFLGADKEGGVGDGVTQVRAQQVGSYSFRGLIGHLQSILQDTDWKLVGRITGQPQPGKKSKDAWLYHAHHERKTVYIEVRCVESVT